MKETRIYVVTAEPKGNGTFGKRYLVEASHPARAEAHVKAKYVGEVTVASAKDVNELLSAGGKVEKAVEGEPVAAAAS